MGNLQERSRTLAAQVRALLKRGVASRRIGRLANLPPVAWALRAATRLMLGPTLRRGSVQYLPGERATRADLASTLQGIVDDVVHALGYNLAMVALYEQGDTLPIHATQFDPAVLTREKVRSWERQLSQLIGRSISMFDPEVARTYVYRDEYQGNLSVKAARAQRPVISDALFDLFTPITPETSRPVVDGIQAELGIKQVIAVPFFLETSLNGEPAREMVGNLFAAKSELITASDLAILSAFGRQAAAALLSERQRVQIQLAQELVLKIQTSLEDEDRMLRYIAEGVVDHMGFMLAMVATYEADGSLPLRAVYFDPATIPMERVHRWEDQISRVAGAARPLRLSDPEVARIYVNRPEYQENLGVQAVTSGAYEVSNSLYSILTPIVPLIARPVLDAIQAELGIHQVITVPFFLERLVDGELRRDVVGNLFTVTRSRRFRTDEIQLLQTFGQQAAAGLRNARQYRQSEDRRAAAQLFGRMAFTASASVHALKNHIGAIRLPLQLINMAIKSPDAFPEDERRKLLAGLEKGSDLFRHLDQAADLLDNLHEPWRHVAEATTDVNACLRKALNKIISGAVDWVELDLDEELPQIATAPDMLTEAFKVLIKNAVEAIAGREGEQRLAISSTRESDATILVTICDNGVGIRPEDLSKIFEMRWSTKQSGLGFGLFWTRDFIEGIGGRISVESVWRQGSRFEIRLPVAPPQARQQAQTALTPAPREA